MSAKVSKADVKTANKVRAYKSAGLIFLASTSIFVTFPYFRNMGATISPALAPFFGAAVSYMIYVFVDELLAEALRYVEKAKGDETSAAKKRFRLMIGIAVVTLFATGGMSMIANFLIANNVVPMPKAEQLGAEQKRNSLAWESGTKELTKAEQKAEQNIRKAKQEGHLIVQNAINAVPKYAELWRSGNNWIRTTTKPKYRAILKWRNSIEKAKQDSAAIVVQAEQLRNKIAEQKAEHLGSVTTVNTAIETAFLAEQNRAATTHSRFTNFLIFMDIFSAFVVAGCSVWLRLYYWDDGELPEAQNSFSEAWGEWRSKVQDSVITSVFKKKTQQSGPTKTTVQAVSTAAPAAPPEDVLALEHEKQNRQLAELSERLREIEEAKQAAEQKAAIAEQKRIEAEQKAQQKKKAEQNRSKPVSNRANKAEQNKTIVVQVVEQNGQPVIEHKGKQGTKYYTLSDVQSQKSTYAGRMKKAKPNSKSYGTNKRNYDIFCAYENELKKT